MFKRTLLVCAISLVFSQSGHTAEIKPGLIEFDNETLKSLGIDPSVSDYFSQKARFMPGDNTVTLKVNGENKGNVIARFNQSGELCFNKMFMEQAGIVIPDDYSEGCYDYLQKHPETVVTDIPGQELLELVVAADAIQRQTLLPTEFMTEGSAAVLNYSAMSSRNVYGSEGMTYSQLQLDGGVNIAGWLLRSQQLVSHSQGTFNSENGQTYLQRTYAGLHTTAQAGEVNMNNALLGGTGLYGVTFTPETALDAPENGARVSGIANTSQARIEIRQQGVLIHSTLVPVGPFTLTDVALRNYTSDLNVTVIETDGTEHSYVVPSSLYLQRIGAPPGLFISLGRVSDDYDEKPLVISVSNGGRLTPGSNINAGTIIATDFQAAGVSIDTVPWTSTLFSLGVNQSYDRRNNRQGQKLRAETSIAASFGITLTAASAYYTSGYREFSESIDRNFRATRQQEFSMGLQWYSKALGAYSASIYETKSRFREGATRYVTAGWGGKVLSAYLSANWQRQLSAETGDAKREDLFYINVSLPLGKSTMNSYARRDANKTRVGSTLSGNLNDDSLYTLGTELGQNESDRSFTAGLNRNLHYTQLMLNGSMTGKNQHSYNGTLQGGIVAHEKGITLSPLPVHDTFGIASLDQPVAGVKIDSPQGPVWTDARGYAVLPSLNAWQMSRIEVSTDTLPKNMDIGNGTRMLSQGRGSVGHVQFSAVTQRRVLLDVTTTDGKKLPKNTAITDAHGVYLTTSVDDGVIFLNNASTDLVLLAQGTPNVCRIKLSLPEKAETGVFYETAKGVCQ